MEAHYELYEIACVIHGFKLVDCESYERHYSSRDGHSLTPGYYVVHWPEHCRNRRFDEQATFHGPFKQKQAARAALQRLQSEAEMKANAFEVELKNQAARPIRIAA